MAIATTAKHRQPSKGDILAIDTPSRGTIRIKVLRKNPSLAGKPQTWQGDILETGTFHSALLSYSVTFAAEQVVSVLRLG